MMDITPHTRSSLWSSNIRAGLGPPRGQGALISFRGASLFINHQIRCLLFGKSDRAAVGPILELTLHVSIR